MRLKIRLFFILRLLSCCLATRTRAQVPATSPGSGCGADSCRSQAGCLRSDHGDYDSGWLQKPAGPYVTAREAYEMWQKDPEKIKILACRFPEEYALVGQASMAGNIPCVFITYKIEPRIMFGKKIPSSCNWPGNITNRPIPFW